MNLAWSTKKSMFLIMGQFTRVNGKIMKGMVMEFKSGPMVENMRVIGITIKPLEKENSGMLMGMYMTVSGKQIRHMGMESILM
jgi:hypothetical protein